MFRYARAGQLLPFLVAADGNQLPVPSRLGQALGWFEEPVLDEQEFQLPPGGTLLLFSDGLTDTANQQGEYFGLEQLNAFLTRRLRAAPQEFCADLWRSLQAYSQGLPQVDDFTIVAMQWKQIDS
jgi:serine phosphatase RsbU (regulator of sigma subunit)